MMKKIGGLRGVGIALGNGVADMLAWLSERCDAGRHGLERCEYCGENIWTGLPCPTWSGVPEKP